MQNGQGVWLLRESVDTDCTGCMFFFNEGVCRYKLDLVYGY